MNCATCRLPLSTDGVCLGCALSGTVGGEEAAAGVRRFAGYELLEEIGQEGGMGSVFKARDSSSGRLVALKMLRADRLRSEELIRRFQIEVEAAANLDHPHVLPIHDVGEHHGQHYYTMRLAGGGSLARQMGLGMWTVSGGDRRTSRGQQERIARLMRAVAEGVQHAHERGVLHRDLKPGNILLDEDGTAYVSDFGLAKQLHTDSELTRTQGMVGTPAYMAPEQAQSGGRDVTARTDVWALGVILYELLTGRVPFEGADALEVLDRVRSAEVVAPGRLNPWIEGDLEVVCLKCLEKEPQRRYGTAGELAADLGCYLESMPISARAPTRWERVVKEGNDPAALSILDSYLPGASDRDLRGFEWHLLRSLAQRAYLGRPLGDEDGFNILADSEPGGPIATGHTDGTVRIWTRDGDHWRTHRSWSAHTNRVVVLSMSAGDRPLVATGGDDGFVRLWDALSGERIHEFRCNKPHVTLSKDGRSLFTSSERGGWGWSLNGEVRHLDVATRKEVFLGSGGAHAVSPGGGLIAHVGGSGIRVRKPDGSLLVELEVADQSWKCNALTFSEGESMLVAASLDGRILCWSLKNPFRGPEIELGRLMSRTKLVGQVHQLCWDPIGGNILIASGDRLYSVPVLCLFPPSAAREPEPSEWQELEAYRGCGSEVIRCRSAIYSVVPMDAEWSRFLVVHPDGTSTGWKFPLRDGRHPLSTNFGQRLRVDAEWPKPVKDGQNLLLYSEAKEEFVRWSTQEKSEAEVLPQFSRCYPIAVLPSSRQLITGSYNDSSGSLEFRSESGEILRRVELPDQDGWGFSAVGQTPDGLLVAIGSLQGRVALLDSSRGKWIWATLKPSSVVQCVQFSPDARHLAVATRDNEGVVLDAETGSTVATLRGHSARLTWFVFAPDGKALYSGGFDTNIRIWDTHTWSEVGVLRGHSQKVVMVDISPDGRTLVSLGDDHTLRLWSLRTRKELVQWDLSGNDLPANKRGYIAIMGNRGLVLPNPRGNGFVSWRLRP